MAAEVLSTAGDATLIVAAHPGHLVNGSFVLAQPLEAQATSPAGTGGDLAPVGGSADPTTLLTYGGPVSHDPVTLGFSQSIGADEPLRTGRTASRSRRRTRSELTSGAGPRPAPPARAWAPKLRPALRTDAGRNRL
jgi:hypothetical protein